MSGLLFRLGGHPPGREVAALEDAATCLHALERGYSAPTRNIRDFGLMNRIAPGSRMLLYGVPEG